MIVTTPNFLSRIRMHSWVLLVFGLLVTSFFLFKEWRLTAALTGVPLDDSWIHFRFSHNLRSGDGFSFNPGVPTPGSTAPLWVILLSLVGFGYLIPSKIIGVLSWLAVGLLVYSLASRASLSKAFSLLAGLSSLAAGRLAWSAPSGMETTTFTLLTLIFLWSWARSADGEIKPAASLILGLACLLRPEGYLLLALSGLAWFLFLSGKNSWKRIFILLSRHFLIAGLVILPYFLFSYHATGYILPNTFYAKTGAWDCRPSLLYFGWIGGVFFMDNPTMAIFAVFGLIGLIRSYTWRSQVWFALAGLWLLALPMMNGFIAPCISGYFTRYTAPLIPVFMLFGAFGAHRVGIWYQMRLQKLSGMSPRIPLVVSLLIQGFLISLVPTTIFWGPYYGQSVADMNTMHLSIANWVIDNTDPSDVIAVNDIGAIGYISDREVIDLMGLVNPEVLPYISGKVPGEWDQDLASYLHLKRPDYLIVFPNWFPTMVDLLPVEEMFVVILETRQIAGIPGITVLGGGEMVVYRLNW